MSRVLALFRPSTFIAISLVIFGTCLGGGGKMSNFANHISHLFFSLSSPCCLPSSTLSQVNPRWASLQQTAFQPLFLFLFLQIEENIHLDGACISWITPFSFSETSSSSCNAMTCRQFDDISAAEKFLGYFLDGTTCDPFIFFLSSVDSTSAMLPLFTLCRRPLALIFVAGKGPIYYRQRLFL